VLDLACGTGRLTHRLAGRGNQVVAVDSSAAMLQESLGRRPPTPCRLPWFVLADAHRLPFVDGAFDAVVSMRLLFHYADVGPIVQEMARVCRSGGVVVFDTASWSPRSRLAMAAGRWGGRVFVHPPAALAAHLSRLGLRVTSRRAAFILSPYLYRLLPQPLERLLEWIEARLPPAWRSRVIWQVRVGD
jgi:ubiquinone/menaquinone biosynthesis C-methylase UbiE